MKTNFYLYFRSLNILLVRAALDKPGEKAYKKRFEKLIEKKLIKQETLALIGVGRHFLINDEWFVVARTGNECEVIDPFEETIIGGPGTPSVYSNTKNEEKAKELQAAFKTGSSEKERNKFKEYKL